MNRLRLSTGIFAAALAAVGNRRPAAIKTQVAITEILHPVIP